MSGIAILEPGERNVPLFCSRSSNSNYFDISFDRSGKSKLKSSDISYSQVLVRELPAVLKEAEAVVSIFTFESRKARLLSFLDPAKEAFECFVETTNHILQSLSVYLFVFREIFLQFRELFALICFRKTNFVLFVS